MASISEKIAVALDLKMKDVGKRNLHWTQKMKIENQILNEELHKMTDLYKSSITFVGSLSSQQSGEDDVPENDPNDFSNDENEDDEGDDPSDDEGDFPNFNIKSGFIIYVVKSFDDQKVVYLNVKPTWRLNNVKMFIYAKWKIPPNFQKFIDIRGNTLYGNLSISDNNIRPNQSIYLQLSISGGGKGVRKSIIKKEERQRTDEKDKSVFEQAFATAVLINNAPLFSLEGAVEEMDVEAMKRMKTFLFKDKSVASTKLAKMHEYFQQYQTMLKALKKLEGAMEELQNRVHKELADKFTKSDDDKPDLDAVKEMVSNTLAVREYANKHKRNVEDKDL